MNAKCNNCLNHSNQKLLNTSYPDKEFCITSDSKLMLGKKLSHFFCYSCGCIYVKYQPKDLMEDHYTKNYDLSEETQNNFVIKNKKLVRKKSIIKDFIIDELKNINFKIDSILEIACGKGDLLNFFSQLYPNAKCHGVDPSISKSFSKNNIKFHNKKFSSELFVNKEFSLIIAHGFLNRSSPTLQLKNIRKIIKKNGLLSIEFMILENSFHAPQIWDHSYWFSFEIFKAWLEFAGFKIIKMHDNSTTIQLLCAPIIKKEKKFTPEKYQLKATTDMFKRYIDFWLKLENMIDSKNFKYIFGAGMHTALILKNKNFRSNFIAIIDEIKEGIFFGLPILNLEKASEDKGKVLIFARPSHCDLIAKKLKKYKFSFEIITYNNLKISNAFYC